MSKCGYCHNGKTTSTCGTPMDCPRCVGTGTKNHGLCAVCQGKGKISYESGAVLKCRACNGTGKS